MIERALRIEYDLTSMNDKFNRGIVEPNPQNQDYPQQQGQYYDSNAFFNPNR